MKRLDEKADLVLLGGKIITMDRTFTITEAIAAWRGIIIGVGSDDEIRDLMGPDTQVLNLEGKTVVPGFNDSHMHPLIYGMDLLKVNCGSPPNHSIKEILGKIRNAAKKTPPGIWINCSEYKHLFLKEKRPITRWDLDQVAPDNPVLLPTIHALSLNSRALELAGITKETPDPEGGHIEKDPNTGEPTGLVFEKAVKPVLALIPPPVREDYSKALGLVSKQLLQEGITSVQEAGGVEDFENPVLFRAYQDARRAGVLRVRTSVMMTVHSSEDSRQVKDFGFYTGFGDEWLRIGPIKTFIDGSFTMRKAAIYPPAVDESLGTLVLQKEELLEIVKDFHHLGWQICAHAQGDRGIELLLDAYEVALNELPRPNHRHRIEHSGITTPAIQKRYKTLGIVVASQPNLIHFYGSNFPFYGPERMRWIYPFKTLLDQGIVVSGGSDCRATPFPPRLGMWSAVNRVEKNSGEVLVPEERVSVKDALNMFTINGAYASFEENVKGSIEPGKYADMVVLDQDPLSIDVDQLKYITVLFTILGGEIVYRA
ncbi:MAG: amidohydrolase [Thermoplasmata archaeon]|nr:MAG: amidohydrolase [Thermoplasmata archaeon]